MKTTDLKSLSNTIASVVDPLDKGHAQMLQEGFLNSLTEKARQIASKEMEEVEEEEEKPSNKKKKSKQEKKVGLEEGYQAKRMRVIRKAIAKKDGQGLKPEVADFMQRSFKRKRRRDETLSGGRGAVGALETRAGKKTAAMKAKLAEALQLDEAGYKRLGRIKGAAYKAELASRGADPNTSLEGLVKAAKLKRVAAEREAQVAAGMARRGGASPDAVRGGGGRLGKSGKYTQKAGALANQRDKALAKFRGRAGYNKAQGMSKSSTEKQISRNTQQFQDDIRKRSRSGDFGQDNQAALRARSNFQKRFGRLKGRKARLDEISDALKSRAAAKASQQVGTYSGIAHGLGGPNEKIKAMKIARKRLGQARKFGAIPR